MQKKEILVDDADYEEVIKFKWSINPKDYVLKHKTDKDDYTGLHRYLLKPDKDMEVDHINGNRLDNRRSNLRVCTTAENRRNKRKTVGKRSSKYKGVYFEKYTQKWRAEITIDYKVIKLGRFANEVDAAIAYDKAAIKYHLNFAKINFPLPKL